MEDLLTKLKGLKRSALKYVILCLMIEGKLDYIELSEIYVDYLRQEQQKKHRMIFGMSIPLGHYWHAHKGKKKHDIFMKCRTAYSLLKSGMYHTAPIEKEFEEWLEKHPYEEDEYGNPAIKTKA
jgi:hypothetical protein